MSTLEDNEETIGPNHQDLIHQLQTEVALLKRQNHDLHLTLMTTIEHGDIIETQLQETNKQLLGEILRRKQAEARLEALVDALIQQNSDLELINQTIIEHDSVVESELDDKLRKVSLLASVDGLTQLANRRRFDEYLEQQWKNLLRDQAPIAVILADIDYFKQYNDTYGHLIGDECLRQVARVLDRSLHRPLDIVARYGGEEFVVVLPKTPLESASSLAEKMRLAVEQLKVSHLKSPISQYITMSFGVACLVPDPQQSPQILIELADRQLYLAKRQGRNQVCPKLATLNLTNIG
jgi:diguanylate cyclase (GGDEF)-like protein